MQKSIVSILKEKQKQLDPLYESNSLHELRMTLNEIGKIAKTEKYYSSLSTLQFTEGKSIEALNTVVEGLDYFLYSYSLNFNAALIHYTIGNYDKTFYYFGKCLRYTSEEKEKEAVFESLKQLTTILLEQSVFSQNEINNHISNVEAIANEVDERTYPINRFGVSIVRKVLDKGTSEENMTDMYKSIFMDDLNEDTRFLLKTERYLGKENSHFSFQFDEKTTIPLAFLEKETELMISIDGEIMNYKNSTLKYGQYNYLTFYPAKVDINSDKPIFIGHPINLKDEPLEKKLVVNLFIDGLSQTFLAAHNVNHLIPKTMKMFKKKYINTNCYASADWTYPSLAGVVTAVDTITHGQYHPHFVHDFSKKHESLLCKIKDAGYFTAAFTGDWRSNPLQGYGSSFNRTVFKNSLGSFGVSEIMEEAIDHLETFKNKNNYLWLVIPDLHDVADEIFLSINSQVNTNVKKRIQQNKGETSVLSGYDGNKIERYSEELKRIDLHLSQFFNYVQQNYTEDEYLIVIHSDHGQGYFLKEDEKFLAEGRTKVPFMLLGDVPNVTSSKLMSNLDIYPTLLKLLNIEQGKYQGKVLEDFGGLPREHVLTESYHPGQPYRAVVHANDVVFDFETKDLIDYAGLVDFEGYQTNILSNSDIEEIDLKGRELELTNYIVKHRIHLQR